MYTGPPAYVSFFFRLGGLPCTRKGLLCAWRASQVHRGSPAYVSFLFSLGGLPCTRKGFLYAWRTSHVYGASCVCLVPHLFRGPPLYTNAPSLYMEGLPCARGPPACT